MTEKSKNGVDCKLLIGGLERVASGQTPDNFGLLVSRAYLSFLGGHTLPHVPTDDFSGRVVTSVYDYARSHLSHRTVNIAGCNRVLQPEDEAVKSLQLAGFLASSVVLPHFGRPNDFSNHLFNDMYNLGFSYVDIVCAAVADEFIDVDVAVGAKKSAVDLAKRGVRLRKSYTGEGFSAQTQTHLAKFEELLRGINPTFIRPYEFVAAERKKIAKKEEATSNVVAGLTAPLADGGRLEFIPDVIFPIAQGGTELGVVLSNVFEDLGHQVITYPLMYSIKTRRHKYPWVQNDSNFLGRSLENTRLLVTEDWVTTGNTLRGILQKIDQVYPREIRVATVKRDPASKIPALQHYKFYVGQECIYTGLKRDSLKDMNSPLVGDSASN